MQLVHKLPVKKVVESLVIPFNFNNHRRLVIRQMDGFKILLFEQISYLESDSNYTKIFMKDGTCNFLSRTLKYYEGQLDNHFLRVHNSVIVNLIEVESYSTKDLMISLFSGKQINVSRRKKAEVAKIFKIYEA